MPSNEIYDDMHANVYQINLLIDACFAVLFTKQWLITMARMLFFNYFSNMQTINVPNNKNLNTE
jgi:hypothetical protein